MMHPNTRQLLSYFKFAHLPPDLRRISKPFSILAHDMVRQLDGPELTAGLRKLLEAKDCMVRAALPTRPEPVELSPFRTNDGTPHPGDLDDALADVGREAEGADDQHDPGPG
jgi:hypothetical protein